jgi:aspartate aminotransferase
MAKLDISARAKSINPSPTIGVSSKVKKMIRSGIDVVDFGVGEPDFDTPDYIKDEGIRAIKEGFTKYTPSSGTAEVKEAIAAKLKRDNGLDYSPEEIIVSCGAKHSLYNAIMALCDEGDEVVIPSPYWATYPEQVRLAGAVPVFATTTKEESFNLKADAVAKAVTARTKLIIINSPNNPTGAVYDRKELEKIADLALKRGFYIISDEIYEDLIYTGQKNTSIAALSPDVKKQTITINGFSKSFAMTGWRLGYAAAPKEIVAAMSRLQDQVTSNPTSFVQRAAVEAIGNPVGKKTIKDMAAEFDRRRKYLINRLNGMKYVESPTPEGAFYAFPDVSKCFGLKHNGVAIRDSFAMADYLLDEGKVGLVPGGAFGDDRCLRISYATSMANIEKGMNRMEEALLKLRG